jgi:uncharacterized membrane protein YvbJ
VRLCPLCATAVPPDNEFCGKCGMPADGARSGATQTVHQLLERYCRSVQPSPNGTVMAGVDAAAVPSRGGGPCRSNVESRKSVVS